MIQNVEWDSQHFNMNVGIYYVPTLKEIFNLESLEHEMKEYLYDVVYVRCKIPVIELENKHTFRDERIVYTKDNSDYPPHTHTHTVAFGTEISLCQHKVM